MPNGIKAILVVVVLAIIGAVVVLAGAPKTSNSTSSAKTTSNQSATSSIAKTQNQQSTKTSTPVAAGTITYDGSSFSPSPLTVKVGDTVKVTNQSSESLVFDSDPHPVHTDEPELNVGAIDAGQSQTFKVTKAGTWGYHNHLNPVQKGTLVVQ
jgi:plastocyanin